MVVYKVENYFVFNFRCSVRQWDLDSEQRNVEGHRQLPPKNDEERHKHKIASADKLLGPEWENQRETMEWNHQD